MQVMVHKLLCLAKNLVDQQLESTALALGVRIDQIAAMELVPLDAMIVAVTREHFKLVNVVLGV